MNDYTVYKHTTPSGKIYIGITLQKDLNRRWQNGSGYRTQRRFYRAIKKYGWENIKHEIVMTSLSKQEAENAEIALIREFQTTDPKYGYNIENGGNCSGTHSEETKKKISEAQLGCKNHAWGKPSPRRGTKASAETNLRNRLSHLGQTAWNKGMKMTEEQKKNMRGKKRTEEQRKLLSEIKSKPIMCVETNKVYKNCLEASKECGIDRSCISKVVNGKALTAGGMRWVFVTNERRN